MFYTPTLLHKEDKTTVSLQSTIYIYIYIVVEKRKTENVSNHIGLKLSYKANFVPFKA